MVKVAMWKGDVLCISHMKGVPPLHMHIQHHRAVDVCAPITSSYLGGVLAPLPPAVPTLSSLPPPFLPLMLDLIEPVEPEPVIVDLR